jgi:inner membrane transporter RhtA
MNSARRLATGAAFLSLLSLQVGAAFAKTIFPVVGPEGIAALRIGIAAAILTAAFRPWGLRVGASKWPPLVLYGAMIGAMNLLIYRAFFYIPVGIAISMEVLGPLAVALLASRRKVDLIWIGLALVGLALLPIGALAGRLDLRGICFALAAAACWGLYVAAGGRVASYGSQGVAIGMMLASVIVLPIGILHAGHSLLSPHVLVFGLIVAVLSSALPFLLDIYALKHLSQNAFGVFMSSSPAASALAALAILGEHLSVLQWCGILSISAACVGAAGSMTHEKSRTQDRAGNARRRS